MEASADLGGTGSGAGSASSEGGEASFVKAQIANEVLKAQTDWERLQKMKPEVTYSARSMAAKHATCASHDSRASIRPWIDRIRVPIDKLRWDVSHYNRTVQTLCPTRWFMLAAQMIRRRKNTAMSAASARSSGDGCWVGRPS